MEWTEANATAADLEGWVLMAPSRNGRYRLQFKGSRFNSFTHLYINLVARAMEGSPLHLKVLALLYATNKDEFRRVMQTHSANQTGTLAKTIITMARMSGLVQGEP